MPLRNLSFTALTPRPNPFSTNRWGLPPPLPRHAPPAVRGAQRAGFLGVGGRFVALFWLIGLSVGRSALARSVCLSAQSRDGWIGARGGRREESRSFNRKTGEKLEKMGWCRYHLKNFLLSLHRMRNFLSAWVDLLRGGCGSHKIKAEAIWKWRPFVSPSNSFVSRG